MEIPNLGRTFLSFEDFSRAPGAGVCLTRLTHDGLAVHPALILGLGLVTEVCGVAVPALNFSIVAIVEGGGIQCGATVVTTQTVLVRRIHLPLHLEDFPLATHKRPRLPPQSRSDISPRSCSYLQDRGTSPSKPCSRPRPQDPQYS